MRMLTLVENSCGDERCTAEHGLSVYIETEKHRLLLDAGQTDALVKNAEALGVDLSKVDTVILSHGHYDHSGGILPFCKINPTATVYMQRSAAEAHFNGERYIGIDPAIPELPNVRMVDGDAKLDDELFLFSGVTGRRCFPPGNKGLTRLVGGVRVADDFAHEQCLVLSQDSKKILLSGCAHNGVLNILDRYRALFGGDPDVLISGFHMMKRNAPHTEEERDVIRQTAQALAQTKTRFFSGHCTGEEAFALMKTVLGDRLQPMHTGCEILI